VNSATAGDRLNFSQLQGQRGLAALGVVVFHAYQYDRSGPDASFPYQGTVADTALRALDGLVDWFFVLSAFLLALPYAKAVLRGSSTVGPGTFLARRAVRIVPLYLVAITLVWASRNPSLPGDWRDLLEHLSFTQVFDTKRIFYTIGPAWSLAVEVQFYLLLALLGSLFVAGARRCSSARVRVVVAFSLPALLFAFAGSWAVYAVTVLDSPLTAWPVWFGLPAKIGIFATGVLAAVILAYRSERSATRPASVGARPELPGAAAEGSPTKTAQHVAVVLRALALGVLVYTATRRGSTGPGDLAFHLMSAPAYALLVVAGVTGAQTGLWHRFFGSGVLLWLGLVSYSLYLWHEPLLELLGTHHLLPAPSSTAFPVTALVLVLGGAAVAWVSWWVVE
jgi:peptidoglycan/LPS O-acetylase OafA/YrhL